MELFNLSLKSNGTNRDIRFTPIGKNWIKLISLFLFMHFLVTLIIYGLNYSYWNIEGTYSFGIANLTKFLIEQPISLISVLFVSTILMIKWVINQHSFPNLKKISFNSDSLDIVTKWGLKENRYSFDNIDELTISFKQFKSIPVKVDEIIISGGEMECKIMPSRMGYLNNQLIQLISKHYNVTVNKEINASSYEFYNDEYYKIELEIKKEKIAIRFQVPLIELIRDIIILFSINIPIWLFMIKFFPGALDAMLMILPIVFIIPIYQSISIHPVINSWLIELNYNDLKSNFVVRLPYSSIILNTKPKFNVIQEKVNLDNGEEKEEKFLEIVGKEEKYILPYPIVHSSNDKIIQKLIQLTNDYIIKFNENEA